MLLIGEVRFLPLAFAVLVDQVPDALNFELTIIGIRCKKCLLQIRRDNACRQLDGMEEDLLYPFANGVSIQQVDQHQQRQRSIETLDNRRRVEFAGDELDLVQRELQLDLRLCLSCLNEIAHSRVA